MVQWLRVHLAMPGEVRLIPGQRTKISHAKEQLSPSASTRVHVLQGKIPHDAPKTLHSQISKIYQKKKKKKNTVIWFHQETER